MDGFSSLVPSKERSPCRTARLPGILLSILFLGIGCGDFTLFGDNNSNHSPQALASADNSGPTACQTETVTLDGTGSTDPDGDTLTYKWQFTTRPTGSTAALQNDTASTASFQPDETGEYVVELTVTDPDGLSDTADVKVTASQDPVADAGNDQSVSIGDTVTLNGDGSVNPEEDCATNGLSFSWSLVDPDGGTSALGTTAEVTFTADMEGTYTATLTVENGSGTDSDQVLIEVSQAAGLLDSLEGGPYLFTVDEVNDGVFAGGLLEGYLQGKTLDEAVTIPSADQVPQDQTISLNLGEGAIVDLNMHISREGPTDEFYTLSGTASGEVAVSIPPYGTVSCELTEAVCTGQLTPETTTAVIISLTISNPVVTAPCSSIVDDQGTIDLTLSGVQSTP